MKVRLVYGKTLDDVSELYCLMMLLECSHDVKEWLFWFFNGGGRLRGGIMVGVTTGLKWAL